MSCVEYKINSEVEKALSLDPLLLSLVRFAEIYSLPLTIDALIAGLPVKPGESGPELFSTHHSKGLFSRAAKRAGYSSRLVERNLNQFSNLLLPCILVLKDQGACILEEIDESGEQAKIILPDITDGEQWVSLEKLQSEYIGFAFLLKKQYTFQSRQRQLMVKASHHWFWGTIARARKIYMSVLVASVVINLFVLATPIFTMNVYDRVVPNDAIETLWVLAIGVIIIFIMDVVLRFIRSYLLEIAGKKSDVIMSSILFEQVMGLRMSAWPKSVGAFANTLREFESIRNFFTSATIVTLVDLPFTFLFLIVIGYIAGVVVVVPLVIILLLLAYSYFMIEPLRSSIESTYEASSNKHALLVESLHSIQTIKSMGVSHHAQWEWEEVTGEIAVKSLKSRMLSSSISTVTHLLMQLSTVGILVVGIYQVQDLELSLGGLIAAVILSSRAIAPMGQVAGLISSYEQTKTAYTHLDELMQKPIERPQGKQYVRKKAFDGGLSFSNVNFSYPDNEWNSLHDISFNITAGEHVGIIGKVGSGKSTLANLLIGLYQPGSGSISMDDIDQQQIDPADLRRHISYLSQEATLFRGTIRDNIVFKDPHIDDESMVAAAKVGGVDLFLKRHPLGIDTPVGEQGARLSGGQRQSVSIARALLLDSPLVILDEPTNSLDSSTEAMVKNRLQKYVRDKTLILVTHKSSMLDLVERLIVMDEGRIIMDGPKKKVLEALKGE
ncbi:MAG: type I secretion system permease/ATPase [Gammaproteobacteria bacterium]|nr:type I secretion system permease/ATPase [Gammaproteobacteria bacterium]